MAPLLGADLVCIAPVAFACAGPVVDFGGLVASLAGVAPELTGNAGAVAIEFSGDTRATDALAAQHANLLSFFSGQVCVDIVLLVDWQVKRAHPIRPLTHPFY